MMTSVDHGIARGRNFARDVLQGHRKGSAAGAHALATREFPDGMFRPGPWRALDGSPITAMVTPEGDLEKSSVRSGFVAGFCAELNRWEEAR